MRAARRDGAEQAASAVRIREAILSLAGEREVDKITVTEIAARAGVARHTFYNHYMDIPDLMEQILNETAEEIADRCLAVEEPMEILGLFVDEMARAYPILSRVLGSRFRARAEKSLLNAMKRIMETIIAKRTPEGERVPRQSEEFLVDLCACMLLAYLLEHFDLGDIDRRTITSSVYRMIEDIRNVRGGGEAF